MINSISAPFPDAVQAESRFFACCREIIAMKDILEVETCVHERNKTQFYVLVDPFRLFSLAFGTAAWIEQILFSSRIL